MKYNVSKQGSTPAYMQLYYQIRKDIISELYPYGNKLPSKRILAEELSLSVITTQHAYELLCDEGYIEARQRSGYFVIYNKKDFISNAEESMPAYPDSSYHPLNLKFSFPFSVMAKTMRKVLTCYKDAIFEKSHHKGCSVLRKTICSYLNRAVGILAYPEQIVIGAGSEYLYSLAVQLLGKNHIYALENPSYEKIRQVYEANGVQCELLELGKNGIKSSQLASSKAKILHVTPFNSYPSLCTASASKRAEYIRWAVEKDGIIVEDNYDSELTISKKYEETLFALAPNGRVLYINTFSQTISPSVRMSYMVLPPAMVAEFDKKLGFYSCTVPVFEQYVLAELINNGSFEHHINRIRREKRKHML